MDISANDKTKEGSEAILTNLYTALDTRTIQFGEEIKMKDKDKRKKRRRMIRGKGQGGGGRRREREEEEGEEN